MSEYAVSFQNQPVDVSEEFSKQESHFFLGSKVEEFDRLSATGKILWKSMALNQRVSYRQVTLPLEDYRVWRDGPPEEYQDAGNNQEDRATARTVQVGQRGRVDCARLAVRTGVRVGGGGRARRRDKEMSLTPIPPERCGRVAPMVVEPREGGYT